METTAQYLSFTFYGARPGGLWTIAIYVVAIGAAIVSVTLRMKSFAAFAVLWFPITLLPISFIPPRITGYVLYIPLLLWALSAGILLAQARRRFAKAEVSRVLLPIAQKIAAIAPPNATPRQLRDSGG